MQAWGRSVYLGCVGLWLHVCDVCSAGLSYRVGWFCYVMFFLYNCRQDTKITLFLWLYRIFVLLIYIGWRGQFAIHYLPRAVRAWGAYSLFRLYRFVATYLWYMFCRVVDIKWVKLVWSCIICHHVPWRGQFAIHYLPRAMRAWGAFSSFGLYSRVTTAQGKQGKWPKEFLVRENTGNLEILPNKSTRKTQGILFGEVVNILMTKVKDIAIFAAKKFIFSLKLDSQFCVCNSHKLCKLAHGKFAVGQEKHRENMGNLKIQFEWVPCIGLWLHVCDVCSVGS